MYQICKDKGYQGIEIAPSHIFGKDPYEKRKEALEYRNELKKFMVWKCYRCNCFDVGSRGYFYT